MLFVPPCINKYYILDLQPENSLDPLRAGAGPSPLRHQLAQRRRIDGAGAWDDYIEEGVIRATRVVRDITGAQTINTLGFCIGGTILDDGACGARGARARSPPRA
jgi:polyhydroxyalkanoate synthase